MLLSLFEQDCIDVRCQWVTDKARRSWFLLEAPVDIAWCDTKGRNIGLVFFLSCPCFWKSFGYCMHPDNNAALQLNFMMLQVGLLVVLHLHCSVLTICVRFLCHPFIQMHHFPIYMYRKTSFDILLISLFSF